MKDGIGKGYTREDHQDLANQLFSAYAKVGEARNLASVIGEDELSPIDKQYLKFGEEFERRYIGQGPAENRTMMETLGLGEGVYGSKRVSDQGKSDACKEFSDACTSGV